MRPISISANNFITSRRIGSANFKMPSFKKSMVTSKKKLGKAAQTAQAVEPPVIDTRGLARVLQKYTIYIDDDVQFKEQLGMIAEGMGATVQHNQDDTAAGSPSTLSAEIYIVQPKRAEKNKLISRLANRGIIAISPVWLFTCYERNTYLSPAQFPYHVKSAEEGLGVSVPLSEESIKENDNPFGLEHVDYDYLEDNRPGRQLNLDNYITVESNTEVDHTYQPTDDDDNNYEGEEEEEEEEKDEDEEEEDEEEAMRREIAYNINKKKRSRTSIKDREERKKASEKRMLKIRNAAKLLEPKTSKRKRDTKKEKYDIPSSNASDRMKIWYAEQPLPK